MTIIWQLVDSSGIGGIEKHVLVLTKALCDAGFDARVVLWKDHGANQWLEQLEQENVPYTVLSGSISGFFSELSKGRPQLVHTHGYKAGIMGRLLCKLRGIPTVSTFHAGETGPFPVSLYQLIDKATAFLGTSIAVSVPIAKKLWFKTILIPNFIDRPQLDSSRPLGDEVAFIGRLSYEKAPDTFCELAAAFADAPVHWSVFGDGPMEGQLKGEYAELIKFHGMVTDLRKIWPRLGVVVIPSRAEGLPLVALEALAAGIPVIASNVGALPEVITRGKTGWLYNRDSSQSLYNAFKEWLYSDPKQLMDLRESAAAFIEQNYSVKARLPQVLSVYEARGVTPPLRFQARSQAGV
ncbi:glycosyltransferase family 4 protein [Pseudovibrio flavus]|uniref:glycosyltransferase family 4 protein n=1 Tax=Pseudovibrio flavus TaxID=2529854 RepID=UPI00211C92BD|nr:glycosyltransferase family 4 protein [Pseudovibrio flavus]